MLFRSILTLIVLAYILVLNYFTELETSPIIVSTDPASDAMIRPIPTASLSRERCPSDICRVKRARKGMLWVMCDTCLQWHHARCVGLTKKKLEALNDYFCKDCC